MVFKRRVRAKTIESLMLVLMFITLLAAVVMPYYAQAMGLATGFIVVIEMLILIIVSIFGMIYMLTKLWELHVHGEDSTSNHKSKYVHSSKHASKKSSTKKK